MGGSVNFTPAKSEAADMAEVRRIVATAGSSFTAGMRILPSARRRAIYAVYAFCRTVDDIADGDAPGAASPRMRADLLHRWEAELHAVYAGAPQTAIGAEIARARVWLDLPKQEFMLILEGMRMDATAMIAPNGELLAAYIRRVAGAIGILSMKCFGAWRGPASERFALNLARGLQLTNILRDVEADAAMGRLYLPASVLTKAGVPHDPQKAARHPHLPRARALLGEEARRAFAAARAEIGAHDRLSLMPALLMMGPYERMLGRWEVDWSRPPPRRTRFGKVLDGLMTVVRPA